MHGVATSPLMGMLTRKLKRETPYMLRKLLTTVAVLITLGGAASTAQASNYNTSSNYAQVRKAVCYYFPGSLCNQAMNVVGCETGHTYSVWAKNGQYLGIFQMGSGERGRFGHGNNAWAQAKAARAYYDYEISIHQWGWRPWSCKPW